MISITIKPPIETTEELTVNITRYKSNNQYYYVLKLNGTKTMDTLDHDKLVEVAVRHVNQSKHNVKLAVGYPVEEDDSPRIEAQIATFIMALKEMGLTIPPDAVWSIKER